MAYIRYKDLDKTIKANVVPISEHVVSVEFAEEKEVNTSGFYVFLDDECTVDIGGESYVGFSTIYRETENGCEYSDDGSVYVEPTYPEYVPTLDEVKAQKIAEMNAKQQEIIAYGVEIPLSDGTTERFTLTNEDQNSIMALQTEVEKGLDRIPWHCSDHEKGCRYYTNADMALLAQKALGLITLEVTRFRDLRRYIEAMTTIEDVQNVTYGMYIPKDYQSEVLADIYASAAQM